MAKITVLDSEITILKIEDEDYNIPPSLGGACSKMKNIAGEKSLFY